MATRMRAELLPDLGDQTLFPRFSEPKLRKLSKRGELRSFAPGEVLYEQGRRSPPA